LQARLKVFLPCLRSFLPIFTLSLKFSVGGLGYCPTEIWHK
jgi:hypothetical protein